MRVLHFSDVHAGGWPQSASGWFDKRLLGATNYWLRRHRRHDWSLMVDLAAAVEQVKPDLVICTGDHSSTSEPREFERAMLALEPLLENVGVDLLFVPGNHDAYVKNARCAAALAEVVERMNRGLVLLQDYPVLREVGGEQFLLVNQASPQSWLSSAGAVEAPAAARIVELLEGADAPVTLVSHFPLFTAAGCEPSARRGCRNNRVLIEAFRSGRIKLALCGHDHTPFARQGPGSGTEICAGSLTAAGKVAVIEYGDDGSYTYEWHHVRPNPAAKVPAGSTARQA